VAGSSDLRSYARWNEEEKMLREYPPSFWRFLLWIGVFRIIDDVLVHPDKHFDPVYPTLLIVGGIISYVLCRRYLRKVRGRRVGRQKQSPEAASPQRG
jgi:prolipoprotein diacylglyceryltransferase